MLLSQVVPTISNKWEFMAWLSGFLSLTAGQIFIYLDNRRRHRAAARTSRGIVDDLQVLNVNVDGKITSLLQAVREAAHAEGSAEATSRERAVAVNLLRDKLNPKPSSSEADVTDPAGPPSIYHS